MDNSQLKNIIRSLESNQEISFILVLTSIAFCFLSALILKYLYINRANSITPKIEFSNLLIVISLITFLMIVIVKSSIALSLGLVGALSIVRFRTPIKEPEDLTYLFLSIALGVGYGSFQILITSVIFIVVVTIIYIVLPKFNTSSKVDNYNCSIKLPKEKMDDFNESFEKFINQNQIKVKFLRSELYNQSIIYNFNILFLNYEQCKTIEKFLTNKFDDIEFNIFEKQDIL